MTDKKTLIAFYSHSGNTKNIAQKIHSLIGGDLFEIKSAKEYPKNYTDLVNIAKKEKEEDIKVELIENCDISNYDTIFLGTPVWWYTFATPVKTFLEDNDFSGKTIIPFCTHGGGGASSTYSDMQELAPKAILKEGYTSYADSATAEEIEKWLKI